jgi:hypothetical protein
MMNATTHHSGSIREVGVIENCRGPIPCVDSDVGHTSRGDTDESVVRSCQVHVTESVGAQEGD